ncbi:two component transcriptional regulator, LytTR family [Spirosomataceae bacterium TFI 002]|nr:two component transcriptional regulator, LytTR family [Spirosomataceae bacterium TFI 002]
MTTCIIIDDEERSVDTMRTIIEKYLSDKLVIIDTASSSQEGYEKIQKLHPQLIFLDIEMPHGSGFDLLERFNKPSFEVIFTTGFEKYAITAIKFSALDYLLKPININDVLESVDRAIERINVGNKGNLGLQMLLENLRTPKNKNTKIPLPVLNGLQMVKVSDIIFCKADEDYTHVYLNDKEQKLVVTKSIKDFEDLLEDYDFFRLHHSYLVNKNYIMKYVKGEGGYITTEFDHEIPVSRRRKTDFLAWLNNN